MRCKDCGKFVGEEHECGVSVMWAKINGICDRCKCRIRDTEKEKQRFQCFHCGHVFDINDYVNKFVNVVYVTGTGKCRWELGSLKKTTQTSLTAPNRER